MIKIIGITVFLALVVANFIDSTLIKDKLGDPAVSASELTVFVIAAVVFLFLAKEIWSIASVMLKGAIFIAFISFLGIAVIGLITPEDIEKTENIDDEAIASDVIVEPLNEENTSLFASIKNKFILDTEAYTHTRIEGKINEDGKIFDEKGNEIGKINQDGTFEMLIKNTSLPAKKTPENSKISGLRNRISRILNRPDDASEENADSESNANENIEGLPLTKEYSAIEGQADPISGDTISINGRWVTLFGIDAPFLNQKCKSWANKTYNCGLAAKKHLSQIISGKKITCQTFLKTEDEHYLGTCSDGNKDIGAQMVLNGWALAYRSSSKVYIPYEEKAEEQKAGIWQGSFQKPWELQQAP